MEGAGLFAGDCSALPSRSRLAAVEGGWVLDNVNGVQFGLGVLVVLVAALLLVGVLEAGVAGAMLIIAIGLIAASGKWN